MKRRHWYFITYFECVICGKTEELRERRYTRRPQDGAKRHEIVQVACAGHFL